MPSRELPSAATRCDGKFLWSHALLRSHCSRENFGGTLAKHLLEITGEMAQIAEAAFESDLGDGSSRIPFQEHLLCTSQAHAFCKSHRRVSAIFLERRVEAANASICLRCQFLDADRASSVRFYVFFRQTEHERRCLRGGAFQNVGVVVPVSREERDDERLLQFEEHRLGQVRCR